MEQYLRAFVNFEQNNRVELLRMAESAHDNRSSDASNFKAKSKSAKGERIRKTANCASAHGSEASKGTR